MMFLVLVLWIAAIAVAIVSAAIAASYNGATLVALFLFAVGARLAWRRFRGTDGPR